MAALAGVPGQVVDSSETAGSVPDPRGERLADLDGELAVDTVTRGPFEMKILKIVESQSHLRQGSTKRWATRSRPGGPTPVLGLGYKTAVARSSGSAACTLVTPALPRTIRGRR